MSLIHLLLSTKTGLPAPRVGQTYYLVGTGDSLANAYPYVDDTKSYQRYAADTMGDYTYSAPGHDNQRTDQILVTFNAEGIATKPNFLLIEGGVNDVAQSIVTATIVANLQTMVTSGVNDGARVVFMPILPWTNGTTPQSQQVDTINAQMIAWMQTNYPGHIIADGRELLGQFRAGGDVGNLWDLKSEYDNDGVHLTELGYQDLGVFIGELILSRY